MFDSLQFATATTFLDLFAGSGSVGLEAASRGFAATLVERDRHAAAVLRRNARRLGLDAVVVEGDAFDFARAHAGTFDVVFASAPYPIGLGEAYGRLLDAGPAAPGGRYMLQGPATFDVQRDVVDVASRWGLVASDVTVRRYGSNVVVRIDVPRAVDRPVQR